MTEFSEIIKKKGKKNFTDDNQKSMNQQNSDSLDKVSSRNSIQTSEIKNSEDSQMRRK